MLVGVVLINAWSIVTDALFNKPFPGDFELTGMGTAIAVFCFLPYCQLIGANVSADIFTTRAGPKSRAAMAVLSAVIAVLFASVLLWRMSAGLLDYRRYEEFTAVLGVPIWYAFVPALISLALLLLAALITLRGAILEMRQGTPDG